jgi:hypothetical protein
VLSLPTSPLTPMPVSHLAPCISLNSRSGA